MDRHVAVVAHRLLDIENKEQAKVLSGFFKTGKGQYGEGELEDTFAWAMKRCGAEASGR